MMEAEIGINNIGVGFFKAENEKYFSYYTCVSLGSKMLGPLTHTHTRPQPHPGLPLWTERFVTVPSLKVLGSF
jgi:hypothetical protein